MNTLQSKKITLATVKSFIKANMDKLYINVTSDIDGMTDCVESRNDGFRKAVFNGKDMEQTMGIPGAWFVRGSRNYFNEYNEKGMTGIRVYNSCGSFVLAIPA